MRLRTEASAVKESLRLTVDYAAIASQLVFLLRSCRFRLLETAAHVLARYILAPPAPDEQIDQRCIKRSDGELEQVDRDHDLANDGPWNT